MLHQHRCIYIFFVYTLREGPSSITVEKDLDICTFTSSRVHCDGWLCNKVTETYNKVSNIGCYFAVTYYSLRLGGERSTTAVVTYIFTVNKSEMNLTYNYTDPVYLCLFR